MQGTWYGISICILTIANKEIVDPYFGLVQMEIIMLGCFQTNAL